MVADARYQQAKKVTIIGAFINALLGIMKVAGGIWFHSHALFADGIHSFSDLLTDAMVLFASKYGSQEADDSHPYGHQRIETAATLLLALVLILAGAGIAWDAVETIVNSIYHAPTSMALVIAVISIIANEGLFHYTQAVGKRIQSQLIIANAWHHRSDAASSIVVLLGLAGSLAGFVYLDAIAAIIVGMMIIKMGWDYGWKSVCELVDTAVEPERLETIRESINQVPGVEKIHQLRSRLMGQDIFVDVHIQVSPFISVSEGHYIAQHVHYQLMQAIPTIKDVTVHVDPEDDEMGCPSQHLPTRHALEQQLLKPWQQAFPQLHQWVIHYLQGAIYIDLFVDKKFHQWENLQTRLHDDLASQTFIKRVHLLQTQKIYP